MTDHVPAAAEGMPTNRRTALALTGSGIVAALTSIATTATASTADSSLSDVEAVIQRHADAVIAERAAWDAVPSDDDPRRPHVRVQVGRRLVGRDNDGTDIWQPVWAHNEKHIDHVYAQNLHAFLSATDTPERKAAVTERIEKRAAAKKAELAALRAEDDRILEEIGFTAAEETATAALDAVRAIEHEILSFVPQTLAAAIRQAQWAVAGTDDSSGYFLDGDDMRALVRSIAAGAMS